MTDISDTILAKSDQLNADDLISGAITITISKVSKISGDQPVVINYEGDNGKPFKPCKTMRRAMVGAWGKDASQYVGRKMTLYCDPKVKWAGKEVGGIRISHMSHLSSQFKASFAETKGRKSDVIIKPLDTTQQPAVEAAKEAREIREEAVLQAQKGLDQYIQWKDGLDPNDKELLRPFHAEMVSIAKSVAEEEIPL